MPTTYKLISKVTVGAGGAANIEFTSIPGTYTDLVIKFSTRDTSATNYENVLLTFNNTGGTAYTERLLYGEGSGSGGSTSISSAARFQFEYSSGNNTTASTFSNVEIYIPNYTSSNNKSISVDTVTENNGTVALAGLSAGLFSNSAAITSIKLASGGTLLAQYSTARLYGIKSS